MLVDRRRMADDLFEGNGELGDSRGPSRGRSTTLNDGSRAIVYLSSHLFTGQVSIGVKSLQARYPGVESRALGANGVHTDHLGQ